MNLPMLRRTFNRLTIPALLVLLSGATALAQPVQPHLPNPPQKPPEPTRVEPPPEQPAPPETQAEAPQGMVVANVQLAGRLLENGDLEGTAVLQWPADFYGQLKSLIADPRFFLRDLASGRTDQELAPDAQARYDDARNCVVLDIHMLGAARNLGSGRWEWLAEDYKFVGMDTGQAGEPVLSFRYDLDQPEEGVAFRGEASCALPAGAADIEWTPDRQVLSYRLPPGEDTGEGRINVRFAVRDRLMSCLYKVYGLETDFSAQWAAKAVITNTGDGKITDLRVRFQLGGYSELDLWQKFPELVPGQTVVAVYHPVLKNTIAELTSTTPANLLAEWKYTDSNGKQHEDSDGGRISILGRHEFVFSNLSEEESLGNYFDAFSNADFIAAWVTRDDPVVKQFAAAANKAAGGAGAPYSDEAATKVLKACYEIMQANNFTYQGPVGIIDPAMSFDNKIVQSIKFPRDVIRDRSGTCIELAALYCSMAHSIGLTPYMVLIPGHAFPVIKLPSGDFMPVETTGVGGGQRYGTAPFDKVVAVAIETYTKSVKEGAIIQVDIEDAWARGVSSPELAVLAADILQRWKIVLDFETEPDGNVPFGKWAGQVSQPMPNGSTFTWPMVIEVTKGQNEITADFYGETDAANQWGTMSHIQVSESFSGRIQDGRLVMRGTKKTYTVDGYAQQVACDTLALSMENGQLKGHVDLADGGSLTFTAERQKQ